jgi:hypothetical protein
LEKALNRANMVSNSLINKNFVIFFALGWNTIGHFKEE